MPCLPGCGRIAASAWQTSTTIIQSCPLLSSILASVLAYGVLLPKPQYRQWQLSLFRLANQWRCIHTHTHTPTPLLTYTSAFTLKSQPVRRRRPFLLWPAQLSY
jgi:hypothetical protein